jgi:hypothetical protein
MICGARGLATFCFHSRTSLAKGRDCLKMIWEYYIMNAVLQQLWHWLSDFGGLEIDNSYVAAVVTVSFFLSCSVDIFNPGPANVNRMDHEAY